MLNTYVETEMAEASHITSPVELMKESSEDCAQAEHLVEKEGQLRRGIVQQKVLAATTPDDTLPVKKGVSDLVCTLRNTVPLKVLAAATTEDTLPVKKDVSDLLCTLRNTVPLKMQTSVDNENIVSNVDNAGTMRRTINNSNHSAKNGHMIGHEGQQQRRNMQQNFTEQHQTKQISNTDKEALDKDQTVVNVQPRDKSTAATIKDEANKSGQQHYARAVTQLKARCPEEGNEQKSIPQDISDQPDSFKVAQHTANKCSSKSNRELSPNSKNKLQSTDNSPASNTIRNSFSALSNVNNEYGTCSGQNLQAAKNHIAPTVKIRDMVIKSKLWTDQQEYDDEEPWREGLFDEDRTGFDYEPERKSTLAVDAVPTCPEDRLLTGCNYQDNVIEKAQTQRSMTITKDINAGNFSKWKDHRHFCANLKRERDNTLKQLFLFENHRVERVIKDEIQSPYLENSLKGKSKIKWEAPDFIPSKPIVSTCIHFLDTPPNIANGHVGTSKSGALLMKNATWSDKKPNLRQIPMRAAKQKQPTTTSSSKSNRSKNKR